MNVTPQSLHVRGGSLVRLPECAPCFDFAGVKLDTGKPPAGVDPDDVRRLMVWMLAWGGPPDPRHLRQRWAELSEARWAANLRLQTVQDVMLTPRFLEMGN